MMTTRKRHVMRLATIWHPDRYLQCNAADLKSKPHHVRLRSDSDDRRKYQKEVDGFDIKLQPMEDGCLRIGHGHEVARYRNTSISGQLLLSFMEAVSRPQPVLIYVPDEVREKAKWKCELRTISDWHIQFQDPYPQGFENLPKEVHFESSDLTLLWQAFRDSSFRVCGFWVNPSHNLDLPEGMGINLVLGPIQGHNLAPADLRIVSEGGRCWIEYSE